MSKIANAFKNGTPVYGTFCEQGTVKLTLTKPETKLVLKVVKQTTMPDGSEAAKLQVIKA